MKFIILLFLVSCSSILSPFIGNFSLNPMSSKLKLSKSANHLINSAFKGITKDSCLTDTHFHAVGVGANNSGNWVNPKMQSKLNLMSYIKYRGYLNASGIKHINLADQEYVSRVKSLLESEPRLGKVFFMAFDYFYNENGTKNLEKSHFYISNDYVYKIFKQNTNKIIPVISVHPDRPDALEVVKKFAKLGVHFIKWLPNSQRINPSLKKHKEFYELLIKHNIAIIAHTGLEKAVEGAEYQKLGNPLLYKYPLDLGVKIIMSHMASLGGCNNGNINIPCFDIFWKMFNNKKYEKNLFTDLSALLLYTRVGKPINTAILNQEYSDRIMYGSDYPLVAVNYLYKTSQLHELGYITKQEKIDLNEIYKYNPLVFHFVLLRTIKYQNKKLKLNSFLPSKELLNMINCRR